MSSLLRLTPNKIFLEPLRIRLLLFLSYALGIETTNTFIHSRSSFTEKLYPIPDQNGQNVYLFLDRNGATIITFGVAHTYMAYLREYHPTPAPLACKQKATLPTELFFRLVDFSVLEKDSASLHELSKVFSEHAGNVDRTQA